MAADPTYPASVTQRRQDGSGAVPSGVILAIEPGGQLQVAGLVQGIGTAPTVGSGGAGVSALSMVANSSNFVGQVNATLTAVAIGAVVGVVSFAVATSTAPKFVSVSVASGAGATGVAIPPVIGADTFTTGGFTLRYIGPNPAATTAAYVITYTVYF